MNEAPHSRGITHPERNSTVYAETRERCERLFEAATQAREFWTEALTLLEDHVPHDEVLVDHATRSFHVLRNGILAHINELCEYIDTLQGARTHLAE